jgi:hypothetical protein
VGIWFYKVFEETTDPWHPIRRECSVLILLSLLFTSIIALVYVLFMNNYTPQVGLNLLLSFKAFKEEMSLCCVLKIRVILVVELVYSASILISNKRRIVKCMLLRMIIIFMLRNYHY